MGATTIAAVHRALGARANPAFLELTTQRATSCRAEYHRTRYLDRETYPALSALHALRNGQ